MRELQAKLFIEAGYKLYAAILLQRLKAGKAEDRAWSTQFGFKSKRGTNDAILPAKRHLDAAWAAQDGQLVLLALDWARAFDSVDPGCLMKALERFGLSVHMLDAIGAVCTSRRFTVRDAG